MFINVPTVQSLTESALKLYFTAWTNLLDIHSHFFDVYHVDLDEVDNGAEYIDEKNEYLGRCRYELQLICNLMQQSNELALKAKITTISPYLLLVGYESFLKPTVQQYDFSDFRTIDAKDLPKIVNALSGNTLSNPFRERYETLRKQRNKIIHLGYAEELQAKQMMEILLENYIELWPERHWLQDRLTFLSKHRLSHFQEYTSPEGNILDNLGWEFKFFTPNTFQQIFRIEENALVCLCPTCFIAAKTEANDPDPEVTKTAYRLQETLIHCLMCQNDYTLQSKNCINECEVPSIAIVAGSMAPEEFCCTCGLLQEA